MDESWGGALDSVRGDIIWLNYTGFNHTHWATPLFLSLVFYRLKGNFSLVEEGIYFKLSRKARLRLRFRACFLTNFSPISKTSILIGRFVKHFFAVSSAGLTLSETNLNTWKSQYCRGGHLCITSHFLVVHFTGTVKGPVCARNFTSPSRSSSICIINY